GLRFGIASALLWPMLLRVKGTRRAWIDGFVVGVLLSCCYLTQVTGLRYTSAVNSAFVTALCTPMVPIVDFALRGRKPRPATLAGIVLALFGVWLLVNPGLLGVGRGELWTLACAFFYAVYLVHLDGALERSPYQIVLFGQLATA